MKKTLSFYKLISVLLTVFILFPALTVPICAASKTKAQFTGRVRSDDVTDLSGIKFDVYESVQSFENSEFARYDNNFLFSVTTDKKGRFSFDRPSGNFVVTADMSTLPKKTGITENMWVITDKSKTSLSANVLKITKVYIGNANAESGTFRIYIYGGEKDIYCDYTTSVSETKVSENVIADDGKRTFRTERKIKVNANGVKKTLTLTSATVETATPVVSLQKPEFLYPASYTEQGGFFEIHYDKTQYSLQTVKNVYGTFRDAKAYFDKYGLKEPIKERGSKKYNIYLVTDGVATATTKHIEKGSSCIVLQTPKNYNRSTHLFVTSSIAHELFHAITNAYTRAYDVVPSKWFRESFANWAGTAFLGYSTETLRKYVNIFQSNPELSLMDTFDSRMYGSMLFALTISEYYGGMDTVRKILEEFRKIGPETEAPEIIAMNKALSKLNKKDSFSEAFLRFSLNNLQPASFYSLPNSNYWNPVRKSADIIYGNTALRHLDFSPLSSKYYDAAAKADGKALYITVRDNAGEYSDTAICCVIKKADGSGKYFYDSTQKFTTYKIKDFSRSKSAAVSFGIVNASADKEQNIDVRLKYS